MSKVFSKELVEQVVKEMKVADLRNATIGDVLLVASRLEQLTGIPFMPKRLPSTKDWGHSIPLLPEFRNSRMRHLVS